MIFVDNFYDMSFFFKQHCVKHRIPLNLIANATTVDVDHRLIKSFLVKNYYKNKILGQTLYF